MSDKNHKIQIFNGQKVRTTWNADEEKWYFSIVDVCGVLTDQPDYDHARNYWKVLKHRLIKEGNKTVTNCNQLKMLANEPTAGNRCRKRTRTNNRRSGLKTQREEKLSHKLWEKSDNKKRNIHLCKIQ